MSRIAGVAASRSGSTVPATQPKGLLTQDTRLAFCSTPFRSAVEFGGEFGPAGSRIPPISVTVQATFLVVDDEPVVLALARRVFAAMGVRGLYTEGGLEVLRAMWEPRPNVPVIQSS